MAETALLNLPLLASGQAQKHVTVNETVSRLDSLVMLSVASRTGSSPPADPADGARHIVGGGATDAWAGQDGSLAIFLNGGWEFFAPNEGWRAWVEDEAVEVVRTSGGWTLLADGLGAGAGDVLTLEFDHSISAGASNSTSAQIPAPRLVLGVAARVISPITGASGWSLGVEGAENRYGGGYGVGLNAAAEGLTGAPLAYLSPTPLKISAEGGNFTGGSIRFAIHYLRLSIPDAV